MHRYIGGVVRVVSCFDGISCGQVALQRAGFAPTTYFASEIDKYAITVTQRNWPETVQLGCVKNVVGMAASGLFGEVDLLMGGSPCQGFSNAGKGLGFVDPRSMLLYDFLMIKNFLQPKYFLLENVRMKKPDQDAISRMIGCEPVFINSADFSAQNRQRLYWTNIPVAAWEDRGILLRDVLEDSQTDRDKKICLDANYYKGSSVENYLAKSRRQMVFQVNPDKSAGGSQPHMQDRVFDESGKTHALTASFAKQTNVQTRIKNKSFTLLSRINAGKKIQWHNVSTDPNLTWRRLSVTECERLQTLPDGYTAGISNTQRYKSIGNGWTVDVIAHILQGMHQC